jgi:hypothetical protein
MDLINAIKNLFRRSPEPVVGKGSVVWFRYTGSRFWYPISDPTPVVVLTDIFTDAVRGVNLHYLTPYSFAKMLGRGMAGNPAFSYANIVNDTYITKSFRTYKRIAMSDLRVLDLGFLRNLAKSIDALNVGELEAIRAQIQDQIKAVGGF